MLHGKKNYGNDNIELTRKRISAYGEKLACVAGVEGEGKGKKRERSLLLSSQFSRGRFDPFPFPPFLRPATQAREK